MSNPRDEGGGYSEISPRGMRAVDEGREAVPSACGTPECSADGPTDIQVRK
jgi:hypothetical protein